ncbi:MAG: hypothetical protein IKW64_06185 [Clostridia bacterium]|nr:hypothetical protein [Clostridia bacterium]
MKRGKRIFLVILLVFAVIVGALCAWQWNNVTAIFKTFSTTQEQLTEEINQNKQVLEAELREKHPTIISDFSAEDEEKIIKGELSVEQAIENLNKKYQETKKDIKLSNASESSAKNKEIDDFIGDKVIELYSLKAYYLGSLGQMEAKVKAEYLALPKEKRTLLGKQELVSKHMGTALGLMNQCDAKVSELLAELESGLKKLGGDTSITKTIKDAYENEKALKKAQYLKLLNE